MVISGFRFKIITCTLASSKHYNIRRGASSASRDSSCTACVLLCVGAGAGVWVCVPVRHYATRIPFAAEMICVRVPDEGLGFTKNRVWRGNLVAGCTAATGAYVVGASVFVLCRLIRLGPVKITSRNDDAFVRGAEYAPQSDAYIYNTRTSHDVYNITHSILYKTVYSCKSVACYVRRTDRMLKWYCATSM